MRENHTVGMNSRIHFTQAEQSQTTVTSDLSFLQSKATVTSHSRAITCLSFAFPFS